MANQREVFLKARGNYNIFHKTKIVKRAFKDIDYFIQKRISDAETKQEQVVINISEFENNLENFGKKLGVDYSFYKYELLTEIAEQNVKRGRKVLSMEDKDAIEISWREKEKEEIAVTLAAVIIPQIDQKIEVESERGAPKLVVEYKDYSGDIKKILDAYNGTITSDFFVGHLNRTLTSFYVKAGFECDHGGYGVAIRWGQDL